MIDISEAVQKIKVAGVTNVRIVPMDGQSVIDGLHKIEVRNGNLWSTIISGVPKTIAENMIKQARSRVILG